MARRAYAEGDVSLAKERYSDYDIVWEDTFPPEGKFDMIVLYHLMQQVPQSKVRGMLAKYAGMLNEGGELIVVVPSLDWATTVLATTDEPPVMAFFSIYGPPNEQALCGFTLLMLRKLVESMDGLRVVYARDEVYNVTIGEVTEQAHQNAICARRVAQPWAQQSLAGEAIA